MSIHRDAKQKKSLENLRALLSHPEQRGRVVSVSELVHKMGTSKSTFYRHLGNATLAQEWLSINQDAPTDAKLHYKNMLDEALKGMEAEVHVTVGAGPGKDGKQFFVPKETAQIKTARAADMLRTTDKTGPEPKQVYNGTEPRVTIRETTALTTVMQVSEEDAIIQRVRDAYVLAPLGDLPNIREIMKGFGLLTEKGDPTSKVTEDQVRAAMIRDEWKQDRAAHLHKTMDLLPDEIKMVTMVRNLEMQKILYNEAKVLHRMNMQHYNTGQAKSLDGRVVLDYTPDSAQVAGLAEVMRRMVDGGTGSVNILINQFGEGDGPKTVSEVSMVSRAYLARLANMNPAEMEEEARRFRALTDMLNTEEARAVSLDDIQQSNDVIDAKSKPVSGDE